MQKTLIVSIIVALVVGAVAFYGGIQYQKRTQAVSLGNLSNGRNMAQRRNGNTLGPGARIARGEIINAGDNNLTVKLPDGSSRLVVLSSNTSVSEEATADKSVLQTGKQVTIFGTPNNDGSITAQMVLLGNLVFPAGRGG